MELLTIEHKDFTMIVECTKFDGIWNKDNVADWLTEIQLPIQ